MLIRLSLAEGRWLPRDQLDAQQTRETLGGENACWELRLPAMTSGDDSDERALRDISSCSSLSFNTRGKLRLREKRLGPGGCHLENVG